MGRFRFLNLLKANDHSHFAHRLGDGGYPLSWRRALWFYAELFTDRVLGMRYDLIGSNLKVIVELIEGCRGPEGAHPDKTTI